MRWTNSALRSTELKSRVRLLEDHVELSQLVARYGPSVDSGSAEATADLWTDDGVFDAVGAIRMQGHEEIAAMVNSEGHQGLIEERLRACAHRASHRHRRG